MESQSDEHDEYEYDEYEDTYYDEGQDEMEPEDEREPDPEYYEFQAFGVDETKAFLAAEVKTAASALKVSGPWLRSGMGQGMSVHVQSG